MNTPSNAGKELLPCPFCGGPADYREFVWSTDALEDNEPECHHVRCINGECRGYASYSRDSKAEAIAAWNRRTTPPTQSQEGETPETDAIDAAWDGNRHLRGQLSKELFKHARQLERRLTAAHRENDRLKSEVAVLDEIMKGERIVTPVNKEHATWMYRTAFDYLNAARAATEEGKRG